MPVTRSKRIIMKRSIYCIALLTSQLASASTAIDGWYNKVFGGYAYLPNNMNNTDVVGAIRTQARYQAGYNAGAGFGYKSNPLRYEGELTYINANASRFMINALQQRGVSGFSNAVVGMANVYYDLPSMISCIQPFVGVGLGYAWVHATLNSRGPFTPSNYSGNDGVFAYQATAGFTYNFAENYALDLDYRYLATERPSHLGRVFQANMANLTAIYRFDGGRYK